MITIIETTRVMAVMIVTIVIISIIAVIMWKNDNNNILPHWRLLSSPTVMMIIMMTIMIK